MTLIDHIIEFIENRDPQFASRIRGASESEIMALEEAGGFHFSPTYRRFLERMGRDMGGLHIGPADFSISAMMKYRKWMPAKDPATFRMIGRATGEPPYDYYLWETQDAKNEPVERLVSFTAIQADAPNLQNDMRLVAGSLPQQIGNAALSEYGYSRWQFRRQVEMRGDIKMPRLIGLDEVLKPLELFPYGFSDEWQRFYEREGCIVSALESAQTGRLIVDVYAKTHEKLDAVYPAVRQYVKRIQP